MSQDELCYRSATALAEEIAGKDVSPVEVVDAVWARSNVKIPFSTPTARSSSSRRFRRRAPRSRRCSGGNL
jgi:hypothetical protein